MTSTTIQCLFAIRNERRANDLTVEALVAEVATSVQATLLQGVLFIANAYTAHRKREERRRHHYRRAMRALSNGKRVVAAVAPVATVAEIADAPQLADAHIIHFASYKTRPVETIPVHDGAELILEAHVCEFAKLAAKNAPSNKATAS